ncbi:MAG: hypothetical protein IKL84_08610 [Clostridia bacterium]|nr:hypothetical protein [Clostridia bacterium]
MQDIRHNTRPCLSRRFTFVIRAFLRLALRAALLTAIVATVMHLLPEGIEWLAEQQQSLQFTKGNLDIRLAGRRLLFDWDILTLLHDKLSRLLTISARLIPFPIQKMLGQTARCISEAFLALCA